MVAIDINDLDQNEFLLNTPDSTINLKEGLSGVQEHRHTYCSNMAKAGMNPKTLQYLMGHSDIGVTMNTYTHLGLEDAKEEMIRMEELNAARAELNKTTGEKPVTQKMFRAI